MKFQFNVDETYSEERLDQFLLLQLGEDYSRSLVQKWIKENAVTNQKGEILSKPGIRLKRGESLHLQIPAKPKLNLEPIPMNLKVLKEWDDFMILYKPAGIACHAGPGDNSPSLVNGLLHHFRELSKVGGESRPGIVHRLDKPTSGVLVVAKTDRGHIALSHLFQSRKIEKVYNAWVLQAPPNGEGTIDSPIKRNPVERWKMCVDPGGRRAITHYQTLQTISTPRGRKFSLVELEIETGRTHQIRVHLQSVGCPIVGDNLYSRSAKIYEKFGLLLFAKRLAFDHPFTGERVDVELELPENFSRFLELAPQY